MMQHQQYPFVDGTWCLAQAQPQQSQPQRMMQFQQYSNQSQYPTQQPPQQMMQRQPKKKRVPSAPQPNQEHVVIGIPPAPQPNQEHVVIKIPPAPQPNQEHAVIGISSAPQPNQEHVVIGIPSTPQPNQEQANEGAASRGVDDDDEGEVGDGGAANREADDDDRGESSDDDDSISVAEYEEYRENLGWINNAYRCRSYVLSIDAFDEDKCVNDCRTLNEKGIDLNGISAERMLTIGAIRNKFNGYPVFEDYEKMCEIFENEELENMNPDKRECFEIMKQQTSNDADEIVNVLRSDEEIFTSADAYVTALLANKLISSDMYVDHDLKDALERALKRTEEKLGSQPYGRRIICTYKKNRR